MKSYTLKSIVNNMFITALFEDQHKDTFTTHNTFEAYEINDYKEAYHLSLRVGSCVVVPLVDVPALLREQAC